MSRKAQRAAFNAVRETCPQVDAAFYDMIDGLEDILEIRLNTEQYNLIFKKCIDKVKEQTTALRDALVSAYEESEDVVSDFENQIEELRDRIQQLEDQIE